MAHDRDGVQRAQLAEVGLALVLSACGHTGQADGFGIGDPSPRVTTHAAATPPFGPWWATRRG